MRGSRIPGIWIIVIVVLLLCCIQVNGHWLIQPGR
jgi:hypothetical protein